MVFCGTKVVNIFKTAKFCEKMQFCFPHKYIKYRYYIELRRLLLEGFGLIIEIFSGEIWICQIFTIPLHLQNARNFIESKDTSRGGAAG